jgi:hypothetical protein
MSILGIGLSALCVGGASFLAVKLFGIDKIVGALRQAFGIVEDGLSWLFKSPVAMAVVAAACLALAVMQWGDARRWRKADEGDAKARQLAEKQAANSHTAFVLEKQAFAAESAALDREAAALEASHQAGAQARAEAHAAGQPTAAQGARDVARKVLLDPKRTTGTTADEWRNY